MTLAEVAAHIGDPVVFHRRFAPPLCGVITGASSLMACVRYPGCTYPQVTQPGDLELIAATAAGREA